MKIWKKSTADTKFSEYIRKRDGKCMRCGRKDKLQCSHFFSRTHAITRYDPENCITLCYSCHYGNSKGWEYDQAGEYEDYMIKWLGNKKYLKLKQKHWGLMPLREAIIEWQELYEKLKTA